MDEVFGYFPPQSNPPSKTPMLTLLKQARAFGLGCVLATQNPVDLDYKGLSNAGTWFLGRLQTERDKMRVLEGLEGASASTGAAFDRAAMEETLAGLGKRVFLMNNVHENQPVVFHTRWAMSYLRGPLTRTHIENLMAPKKAAEQKAQGTDAPANANVGSRTLPPPIPEKVEETLPPAAAVDEGNRPQKPLPRTKPPKGVREFFVDPHRRLMDGERMVYRPMVVGTARLHYSRSSYKIDEWVAKRFVTKINAYNVDDAWMAANEISTDLELHRKFGGEAEFAELPEELLLSKNFTSWNKQLKNFLYREQGITILKCPELKEYSHMGEDEAAFRVRLSHAMKEKRDVAIEKLRKRYASKLKTLGKRIERAEQKVDVEKAQFRQSSLDSVMTIGSSIFGALLGRKTVSKTNVSKASTSVKSVGRAAKQKGDITRAKETLKGLQSDYEEMEMEFEDEVELVRSEHSVQNLIFDELDLAPKKTDIAIKEFGVIWLPWIVDSSGVAEPLF